MVVTMPVPAEHVRSLHPYEQSILRALERLMRWHEWVPLDILKSATKLSEGELAYQNDGDLQDQKIYIYQVQGGDWVQVYP